VLQQLAVHAGADGKPRATSWRHWLIP